MTQLQHDIAFGVMRSVFDQLKPDLSAERRMTVMYLLYYSVKAGLERYETLVERRHDRLFGPQFVPSDN